MEKYIRKLSIIGMIIGIVIVFVGCTDAQEKHLRTGNIEGVTVDLTFENTGKIIDLSVGEGQTVHKGDVLGQQDTAALELKNLSLALQIQKLENQRSLLINRVSDDEAKALNEDADSAQSQLSSLRKDLKDQQTKTVELKALFDSGAISSDQYDDAVQRQRKLSDQIQSAESTVSALKSRIADKLEGPKAEELKAIDLDLQLLDIQHQEIMLNLQKSVIIAPIDGIIEVKYMETGEFAMTGVPVYKLIQIDNLTMTLYVQETELRTLSVGQKLSFVDESIDQTSYGTIAFISSTAEFTPKNVESTDSKHELVYRIRLTIEDPTGQIKPGMFLTAFIGEKDE